MSLSKDWHSGGSSGNWSLPPQVSTTKVPPGWGPELRHQYSFRQWKKDVRLWKRQAEFAEEKVGPAIAQRLRGVARKLAEQLLEAPSDCVGAPAGADALTHGLRFDAHDGRGIADQSGMNT